MKSKTVTRLVAVHGINKPITEITYWHASTGRGAKKKRAGYENSVTASFVRGRLTVTAQMVKYTL